MFCNVCCVVVLLVNIPIGEDNIVLSTIIVEIVDTTTLMEVQ